MIQAYAKAWLTDSHQLPTSIVYFIVGSGSGYDA